MTATEGQPTITGAHVVLFSVDAAADRAFLRDVLGLDGVDAGDGWSILALPPAEVAVHPTGGASAGPVHELYLMCDDVVAVVAALEARDVEIVRPVSDEGWGLLATFRLPSGLEQSVYEPRHPTPHDRGQDGRNGG